MNKVSINLTNYGKNEKVLASSEDVKLILVTGKNGSGKSTVITAIREIYEGQQLKKDPINHNAEIARKEFILPDKDGNPCTITVTITPENKKGTISVVDHNGKQIGSVKRAKELLGYSSPLDVDTIFHFAKKPAGRRSIIDELILPAISSDIQERISEIDFELSGSAQSTFTQRRDTKRDLDALLAEKSNLEPITEEDEKNLSLHEKAKVNLNELVEHEKVLIEENARFRQKEERVKQLEQDIAKNENEINELLQKIENLKIENAESLKRITALNDVVDVSEDLEKTKQRIDAGNEFINSLNGIIQRKHRHEELDKRLSPLENAYHSLDQKVTMLRNEKKKLMEKSSLPDGLSIDGDDILINGVELSVFDNSTAEMKEIFAKLKMDLETAPIIDLGSISDYDERTLQSILSYAEQKGKLPLLEKVTGNENVEVFFSLDATKQLSNNTEKLF